MRLPFWILPCVVVFVLNPAPTFATTTSGNLSVSATVNASCNISDIANLAFGELSAGMLPETVTTTFNVTCTHNILQHRSQQRHQWDFNDQSQVGGYWYSNAEI